MQPINNYTNLCENLLVLCIPNKKGLSVIISIEVMLKYKFSAGPTSQNQYTDVCSLKCLFDRADNFYASPRKNEKELKISSTFFCASQTHTRLRRSKSNAFYLFLRKLEKFMGAQ